MQTVPERLLDRPHRIGPGPAVVSCAIRHDRQEDVGLGAGFVVNKDRPDSQPLGFDLSKGLLDARERTPSPPNAKPSEPSPGTPTNPS